MNLLSRLPLELQSSLEEVKQMLHPHSKRVYLVGGTLRDILTNRVPKDLDVEIYDISPQKFAVLAKKWGALGVGKSFFVYKYKDIDFSLPRIEKKVGFKHTDFKISHCSDEKEASKRRDFTMNALMVDIFSGELFDFWGGVKDIQQKSIRLIDQNKFQEDPLRVLRGVRFAAELAFVLEKYTLDVMKNINLTYISKERIFWELEKIFVSDFPELGFLYLYDLAFFENMFALKMSFDRAFEIARKIRMFYDYKTDKMNRFIFLYVLFGELGVDIKEGLKKLNAPKQFFTFLVHSPYKLAPLSDKDLLKLSLEKPLCKWVGICQKDLKKRAKELGIYEQKVHLDVNTEKIIKQGFKGKDIGIELRKKQVKIIESMTH